MADFAQKTKHYIDLTNKRSALYLLLVDAAQKANEEGANKTYIYINGRKRRQSSYYECLQADYDMEMIKIEQELHNAGFCGPCRFSHNDEPYCADRCECGNGC